MNLMNLATPQSAVLSAVIFNALIIPALIPLAFRGVKMIPQKAIFILRRNLTIYGIGGVVLPFIGIKLIDMAINAMGVL
jgi:K+-transporting ATPase ATPase B chain